MLVNKLMMRCPGIGVRCRWLGGIIAAGVVSQAIFAQFFVQFFAGKFWGTDDNGSGSGGAMGARYAEWVGPHCGRPGLV